MPPDCRVRWAVTAEGDLDAIVEYVARGSVDAALEILGRLRAAAGRLSTMPQQGRLVPELQAQGILTCREVVVPPWRLLYRIEAGTVWVLAVFDSRRNLEDVLLERLTRG